MMSPACCIRRAEACEQHAAQGAGAAWTASWLAMAREWRALAKDETAQATLARLMSS